MNFSPIHNSGRKRQFDEIFDELDDLFDIENLNKIQKTDVDTTNEFERIWKNFSYWDVLPNEIIRIIAQYLNTVKDIGNFELACKKNERNSFLAWRQLARIKQLDVPWECCKTLGDKKDKYEYILSHIFYSYIRNRYLKKQSERLREAQKYQTIYEDLFNRFPLWGHFFRRDLANLSGNSQYISTIFNTQINQAALSGAGENLIIGFTNHFLSTKKWVVSIIKAIELGATVGASWLFNLNFKPHIVEAVAIVAAKNGDVRVLEKLAIKWDENKLIQFFRSPICPPKIMFELGLRKLKSNLNLADEYIDKAIQAYKDNVPKEVLIESMILKTNLNNYKEASFRYFQIIKKFSSFEIHEIAAFIKNRYVCNDYEEGVKWCDRGVQKLFLLDAMICKTLAPFAKLMNSPHAMLFYYVAVLNDQDDLSLSFLVEGADLHYCLNCLDDAKLFYDRILKRYDLKTLEKDDLEKMFNVYSFHNDWEEVQKIEAILIDQDLIYLYSLSEVTLLNLTIFYKRHRRYQEARSLCNLVLDKNTEPTVPHHKFVKINCILLQLESSLWNKTPLSHFPHARISAESLAYMSFIECKLGNKIKAMEYLEAFKSEREPRTSEDALMAIGYVLDQLGLVKEAEDLYVQISYKYNQKKKMPLDLILCFLNTNVKLENYTGTLKYLKHITKENRNYLTSQELIQVAQVYYQEMQQELYLEYFELAMAKAPKPLTPNIAFPYIQMLISENRHDLAGKMYLSVEKDPSNLTTDQLLQSLALQIVLSRSTINDEKRRAHTLITNAGINHEPISISTLLFMMESLISKEVSTTSPLAKLLYQLSDEKINQNQHVSSSNRIYFLMIFINHFFSYPIAKRQFDLFINHFNSPAPLSLQVIHSRAFLAFTIGYLHDAEKILEPLKLNKLQLSDCPKYAHFIALAIQIKNMLGINTSTEYKELQELFYKSFLQCLNSCDEDGLIKLIIAQYKYKIKNNGLKIKKIIDKIFESGKVWSQEFLNFLNFIKK